MENRGTFITMSCSSMYVLIDQERGSSSLGYTTFIAGCTGLPNSNAVVAAGVGIVAVQDVDYLVRGRAFSCAAAELLLLLLFKPLKLLLRPLVPVSWPSHCTNHNASLAWMLACAVASEGAASSCQRMQRNQWGNLCNQALLFSNHEQSKLGSHQIPFQRSSSWHVEFAVQTHRLLLRWSTGSRETKPLISNESHKFFQQRVRMLSYQ